MALTLDNFKRTVFGNKRIAMCDCDFDASYPTGGEALTPENLGMVDLDFIIIEPRSGYVFTFDYTNEKVIAYVTGSADGAVLSEEGNITDMSAVTNVKIFAVGTGLA